MPDIKAILDLWFKLRETPKDFICVREVSHANPWDYSVRRDMEQAFELDPEGLTALLLLDNFRSDFFDGCGLSISDILSNPNYQAFIQDCRQLQEMLSDKDIVCALRNFVESVSSAIHHMKIEREDVTTMLNSRYDMAILRRDALNSMRTLHLHQFYQGDTRIDHLVFLPDIHLFWNMNSCVRCAWQSPDGVSVNLIKDPLDTSSYFAFVAKNGGNLTIITDKPHEAHPISKYMARRPEKSFTRRIFRNHFPYSLLDLKYDYKGYARPGKSSLVPLQEKPIKIGSICEMEPDEVIWTVMMFSLIDEKLYKANYHCGELSYTSDMIENPRLGTELLEKSEGGALMVKGYKPLEAPVLNATKLENDPQYNRYSGSGHNNWLFDRYKDQIPEDIMNGLLPSDGSVLFMLPDGSLTVASGERVERVYHGELRLIADHAEYMTRADGVKIYIGDRHVKNTVELKKMTGDEFGSAEELMSDYRWFARYNSAKFVQHKAQEEFNARKQEIERWVLDRIERNLERICRDGIQRCVVKDTSNPACRFHMAKFEAGFRDNIDTYHCRHYIKNRSGNPKKIPLYDRAVAGCWFSDNAPCSYVLRVSPVDLQDLLYLVGSETAEELPDVLQHWRASNYADPCIGNCILDRTDPMDWAAHSPWNTLHFNLLIGFGKKHFTKVKKELGITE